jgi:hypothetical protein
MLTKWFNDNLAEDNEKGILTVVEIEAKMTTFYKQQARTIEMFQKTGNTRKEDIQTVLENLEVILL